MPKILAIVGKQDNSTTMSALLKSFVTDCIVITAISGKEGIEKAKAELPDTILLDIEMPEMDGFEVCKKLKSDNETKYIPVIVITGIKTETKSRVKGLEVGADAFLSKPIDESELVAQVKVMLRIKKAEDILRNDLEFRQKETKKELRESEKGYRTRFEDSKQATSLTQNGKIVAVNQPWITLHGFKDKKEIIGKDILDFILPEDKHIIIERRKKWPRKMESVYEIRDVRKDGSVVYVEVYASKVSVNGKDTILTAIHDISKRKEAEEILRDSERRYRSLVESTEDSIYLVDRDCRYQFMNEKHLSRIGLEVDKILGRTYAEFHTENDTKEFIKKIDEVFKSDRSVQHEHSSNRDGRHFVRTFSPVKKSDGRTIYVTVVSKDITARKRTEERLRFQLETASKIQSLFKPQLLEMVAGSHVWGISVPAAFVGGDLYDLIPMADGSWMIYVADVSDKGLPAALIMVALWSKIRGEALLHNEVDKLLEILNDAMCDLMAEEGFFATIILGKYWPASGRLQLVCGGHLPPIWIRKDGLKSIPDLKGLSLGVTPGTKYEKKEITLSSGESILFLTDGVTEAENDQSKLFGDRRLIDYFEKTNGPPFGKGLLDSINAWQGATKASDDLIMLEI